MAEFFINLVVFILALAFTVVIHELGHFITAKAFNVYVTEFSIGFGPALFTRKGENKETRFSIRAVPLGGYCAMVGESMPDLSEEEYKAFVRRHSGFSDIICSESNEQMLNSYYILNSIGCFLDNKTGKSSKSLLKYDLHEVLLDIFIDEKKYSARYA